MLANHRASAPSPGLFELTFAKAKVEVFSKTVAEWPVQALECKSLLPINKLYWQHGRDRFIAHPGWCRELMRRRGYFSYPKLGHQQGQ